MILSNKAFIDSFIIFVTSQPASETRENSQSRGETPRAEGTENYFSSLRVASISYVLSDRPIPLQYFLNKGFALNASIACSTISERNWRLLVKPC